MPPPRIGQGGESTFYDHAARQGAQHTNGSNNTHSNAYCSTTPHHKAEQRASPRRWSYVMQDIPHHVLRALNHVTTGYTARLLTVLGLAYGVGYLVYHGILVPSQRHKPLAQRNYLFSPRVPITLLEKRREGSSRMYIYRFALPNSYDYAGYTPVSSVLVYSGIVRDLRALSRWYTPISHPSERGAIEFAIKDCDPGRMSARLRYLEPGDVIYLGRWMREFRYEANAHEELGLLCTTSAASVALQLMNVMAHNPHDRTRLRLLYCHDKADYIPFKTTYFDPYVQRLRGRLEVQYNVLASGRSAPMRGLEAGRNLHWGLLDERIVQAALPAPVQLSQQQRQQTLVSAGGEERSKETRSYRPPILVCGPSSLFTYLCGPVSWIGNWVYWGGPFYQYGGFLRDMGYRREQVYKFGNARPAFPLL